MNVAKIIIGFGDETQAVSDGVVYFEDIRLYSEYPPPEHSAMVEYDGYPEYIKEPRWHVWNIPLAEFQGVNLANIKKIAIGFGDGNSPYQNTGAGTVYFEDIILRQGPAEDIYYDGSVYLDEDPFDNNNGGYMGYPLLLKQDCRLIDAGGDYIDELRNLVGKTTAWEGFPDSNVADIGFHYFNWYYVNAWDGDCSFADMDDNMAVDLRDFALLADGWETIYDINDLKIMADRWLWSVEAYQPIAVNITGDPNNLTGDVPVRISGLSENVTKGFIYVDGELNEYIDYMMLPEEANNCALLDTKKLSNGQHNIKVATVDINGIITMSQAITVDTNNELYYVTKGLYFEPNDGYPVYAMSDTNSNFRVRLAKWDGNTIWTSEASSGGLNVTVPSSVLTGQSYNVVLEVDTNEPLNWRTLCEEPSKSRRRRPGPYKVAIFLPNSRFEEGSKLPTADSRWRAVDELIRWCDLKDMKYVILYRGECTWEGFCSILSMPSVSYVYLVSHGGYQIKYDSQIVNRLWFNVSGPRGFGTKAVCSYTDGLPEKEKRKVHNMHNLGLHLWTQIRLVYMTVCYQGRSNEMAEQWLNWSWQTPPGQLFCGWRDKVYNDQYWKEWDYDFWHYFGSGDHDAWWVYSKIQDPDENLFGDEIALEFELRGDQSVTFKTTGNQ